MREEHIKNKSDSHHIKEVLLMFPWNKTLPLFYCTLKAFIFCLQQSSLWTDVRDFLIICPINAGCLIGGGCITTRLLAWDSRILVMTQVLTEANLEFSKGLVGSGIWLWKMVKYCKQPGHVNYDSERVRKNCCQYLSCHMAQQLCVPQTRVWFLPSGVSVGKEQTWQPVTEPWLLDAPLINAVYLLRELPIWDLFMWNWETFIVLSPSLASLSS